MTIDFTQVLMDMDGEPLTQVKKANGEPVKITLGGVCVDALLAQIPDEKMDGKESFERFNLANRIHGASEPVDIAAEDIAKIKACTGKLYLPLIVGQVWNKLEQRLELVK